MSIDNQIIAALIGGAVALLVAVLGAKISSRFVKYAAVLIAIGMFAFVAIVLIRPDVACRSGINLGEACGQGESVPSPPPSTPIKEPVTSPREQQLNITLQPMIEGMGKIGCVGVSGALSSDSPQSFGPPSFGDERFGIERRGFISFSLSQIPEGFEIIKADLYLVQGGGSGNLDPGFFSLVLLETVDVGGCLGEGDFGRTGTLLKRISLSEISTGPHDVTDAMRLARLSGHNIITFRLRFSVGNNNDNKSDSWSLSYSSGDTRLEIVLSGKKTS